MTEKLLKNVIAEHKPFSYEKTRDLIDFLLPISYEVIK